MWKIPHFFRSLSWITKCDKSFYILLACRGSLEIEFDITSTKIFSPFHFLMCMGKCGGMGWNVGHPIVLDNKRYVVLGASYWYFHITTNIVLWKCYCSGLCFERLWVWIRFSFSAFLSFKLQVIQFSGILCGIWSYIVTANTSTKGAFSLYDLWEALIWYSSLEGSLFLSWPTYNILW